MNNYSLTVSDLQLCFLVILIFCLLIKIVYFKLIKTRKSYKLFLSSFYKWYNEPEIHNSGNDIHLKKFLSVSNYCIIFINISILIEIVLYLMS